MADDKFRQERRRITPDDLGDDFEVPETPVVGDEGGEEPSSAGWKSPADLAEEAQDGLKIKNMPPQYAKMFKQKAAAAAARRTEDEQVANQNVRITGSGKLEELIAKLRPDAARFEEIKLPSRGRFYDGDNGPEDGILHLRPMTGDEEQILTQPRFVKKGTAINMIFQRCLKEGFRPEHLLSVDRTYMLIWLRGISYGQEYEVDVTCPFTDRKFPATIDLGTLLVNYCPNDYGPDLTDKLPASGFRFSYRLSTGKDEQDVQDYRDVVLRRSNGEAGNDDSLMYRTALLLNDVEGVTDKQELLVLLKKLPIKDVAYLRNAVTEPPFGTDTKVTLFSPYTSDEFEIDLPLETAFFFPKTKKKTS